VWKLTGQYKTDFSNASRTQLFNIRALQWDREICAAFGIDADDLPTVTDSDAVFGETDLGGWLPRKIPICGVLGDSHAALFGHGCVDVGMAKATYGTGSSIMMNIGPAFAASQNGLVTSLAWKYKGQVSYVMEGNLNYTGAVITWLKDSLGIIASAGETEALAKAAHPADTACLVPAFTGLGAPYWKSDARAMLWGMSRTTGKNEVVKAGLESIAYQVTDIVEAMGADAGVALSELRVDGGPTGNPWLMQFQSDMTRARICVPKAEELSALGAAYMAGMGAGLYDESVLSADRLKKSYEPQMNLDTRKEKYSGWQAAVKKA
jgi:glycerol kinase